MSLARDVATAVLPPLGESRNIGRVARGIQRDVPTEDLRELGTRLLSPKRRMYIAGLKAKFLEESVAVFSFVSKLKRC